MLNGTSRLRLDVCNLLGLRILLDPVILFLEVFFKVMPDSVWALLGALKDVFALPDHLGQSVFAEHHVDVRVVIFVPNSIVWVNIEQYL